MDYADYKQSSTHSTNEQTPKKQGTKLSYLEKLTFGLGDFGANFSWTFIASFIAIYMTDTAGISAGVIGTIILFSRVFDGFTDVFMGTVIDNTNTKMGKAKPWVFWTAPILGLLTFMLFNVPDISSTARIAYVAIVYLLISAVFYTANNVAYSSLTSFMTKNEKERTALGGIRFIFANAAVLFINAATIWVVNSFGGGQQGWTWTALIFGLLCALPLMITGFFVKERNVAKNKTNQERVGFFTILRTMVSNKYFNLTLVLYFLWYLRQTENAARVYYAAYVFNNENLMGILSAAALVPMIIGLLFAPQITEKLGMKKTVLYGLGFSIVGYLVMTFFSENLTGFIIGTVINGFGLAPLQAGLTAIVADVGDIVYWKSGIPVQGSVFSITSAGMKIGQGITAAIVGWSLEFGGYIANTPAQPDGSIFAMKSMMVYFPFLIVILMIIVMLVLNYDHLMPQVREDLNKED